MTTNPDAPELARRKLDVSVLFVDISGYTRLGEQLKLEDLNALIEQYFSRFLDHIRDAGGDINETAGDGFMAIFQDADAQIHTAKAVKTSLSLLDVTDELNWKNNEYPLPIHMGINSGMALVGSVRFECLRGARWSFTASGPVVNLAARLEASAGVGQILIGPETMRRLGDRYPLVNLGCQPLKNITEPIDIYCLLRPLSKT